MYIFFLASFNVNKMRAAGRSLITISAQMTPLSFVNSKSRCSGNRLGSLGLFSFPLLSLSLSLSSPSHHSTFRLTLVATPFPFLQTTNPPKSNTNMCRGMLQRKRKKEG